VGIGTASIDSNAKLQIEDSTNPNINIDRTSSLSTGNHLGYINFQNNGDVYGYIGAWVESASGTDGKLVFGTQNGTSSTDKMTITSDGSVLVGKASDAFSAAGTVIRNSGVVNITRSGANALNLNRLSSDGSILDFYKDTSTLVGSISTYGGLIQIGQGNANLKFSNAADAITPANGSGSNNDNAVDLGATAARFKDGYFSGDVNATNFTGVADGNTFINFPGSDVIKLFTGGTERFRLESNGYVHMAGAGDVRLTLGSQGTAGNNDANWIRGSGTSLSYNAASANHIWETGGAEKMRLNSNGHLRFMSQGAGTQNNSSINNHTNNYMYFMGGSAGAMYQADNSGVVRLRLNSTTLALETAGYARMTIASDGRTTFSHNVKISGASSYSAANLAEANNANMALHISPVRASVATGISMGDFGSVSGIQAYNNSTNAAQSFVLNPFGGNVGIGTNAPGHVLHVKKPGSGDAALMLETVSGGDPTFIFNSAQANRSGIIKFQDNGTHIGRIQYVHNGDRIDIQAGSASGAAMTIKNTSVGIGVINPLASLDIKFADNANPLRLHYASSPSNFYLDLDTTIPSSGIVAYNWNIKNNGSNYANVMVLDRDMVILGNANGYGSRLTVQGAISTIAGSNDLASISTETGSIVTAGSIHHEIGYAGTYSAGKTFTWTYAATSWKAWTVEIKVASTSGFAILTAGGYWNNGGPLNVVELADSNTVATLSVTNSGQALVFTVTCNQTHVHPFFSFDYQQSGGDGAPRMDRLSLVQT